MLPVTLLTTTVVGSVALVHTGGGMMVQLFVTLYVFWPAHVAVTTPVYPVGQEVVQLTNWSTGVRQVPLFHVMLRVTLLMTIVLGGRVVHPAGTNKQE
jgi:hypothetical protein